MAINRKISRIAGKKLRSKKSDKATKSLAGHVISKCRRKKKKITAYFFSYLAS